MGNLTASLRPQLRHSSITCRSFTLYNQYHFLCYITNIVSIGGYVYYCLWSVCSAPLCLDWNLDVFVALLPEAVMDVTLWVYLRVEGEDTLVVATHQEDWRQVLRQCFQPGHVQSTRHCPLSGQWQTPAQKQRKQRRRRPPLIGQLSLIYFYICFFKTFS